MDRNKKGDIWPQTKIPKNPFELNESHSEKAIEVFELMKNQLLVLFKGVLDEEWLWTIRLKNKVANEIEEITIDSFWGGFTPDNN